MSRADISEKKEKSLAEQLIIVVIISVLMATFWRQFNVNEQAISDTGFKALANSFTTKVQTVHAQWFMDKQPNIVSLKDAQGNVEKISVNQHGWVDTLDDEQRCLKIWQQVMNLPLVFIKQPISVVTIKRAQSAQYPVCRYGLNELSYFEYNIKTGKITL